MAGVADGIEARLDVFLAEGEPAASSAPATPEWDPDLIPDPGSAPRSAEDDAIDTVVNGVDIITAYTKWCGKMTPEPGGRSESVMISCPKPDHPDKNPSAWLNLDKGTWFCGGCQEGGDKFHIAGYYFDIDAHDRSKFPELRRRMAEDLGYTVRRTVGGQEYIEVVAAYPELPNDAVRDDAPDVTEWDEEVREQARLAIDWRALLPADTFLRRWMETVTVDELPEEYHLWLGLQMVGLAAGDSAVLMERNPIKGNLFLCLFGSTGVGKSKAVRSQALLLREALPYDDDDINNTGVIPGDAGLR